VGDPPTYVSGWLIAYGGTSDDGIDAVVASGAGVVVAGTVDGRVDVGGESIGSTAPTFHAAAFDGGGATLWAVEATTTLALTSQSLAADGGEVALGATYAAPTLIEGTALPAPLGEDVVVARFDRGGGVRFSRGFVLPETQRALAVAVAPGGGTVVAGSFVGGLDLGAGAHASAGADDAFVALLDAEGNALWSRTFGGGATDRASGVAVADDGTIWVAGQAGSSFGVDGVTVESGGLYVLAFDGSGDATRGAGFATPAGAVTSLVASRDGLVLGGSFRSSIEIGARVDAAGDRDGFVAALDVDLTPRWAVAVGGAGADTVHAVAATGDGGVVVAARFTGDVELHAPFTSAGADDGLVLVLDADGAPRWAQALGRADVDAAMGIAAAAGGIVVGGFFRDAAELGGKLVQSSGGSDAFLGQLAIAPAR
jgi:hypothetical protein